MVAQQGVAQLGNPTAFPQGLGQGLSPGLVSYGAQSNPIVSSVNTPTLTTHQSIPTTSESSAAPSFHGQHNVLGSPVGTSPAHAQRPSQAFAPVDASWAFNGDGSSNAWSLYQHNPTSTSMTQMGANRPGTTIAPAALHEPGAPQEPPRQPGGHRQFPGFNPDEEDMREGFEQAEELYKLYKEHVRQQEESKPHRCPVIGCDKAYKNLNGLKYHRTHGHQSQKLQDNGDGTFSIIDPDTSAPYPGAQGMEKEKPYNCDVCGKRYKNLNGLKYVRFPLVGNLFRTAANFDF
jgi:transcription factor SFP1